MLALGFSPAAAYPPPGERRPRPRERPADGVTAENAAGLTEHLGPEFDTHTTEHFLIVHAAEDADWARRTGRLLERAHAEFHGMLGRAGFRPRPLRNRLVWVYFENRDRFQNYASDADQLDMSWSEGYYSARTNRVAVLPDGATDPEEHRNEAYRAGNHTAPEDVEARPAAASAENGMAWSGGTGEPEINVERTRHEAAHQLAFNLGLQKRGVMYPIWVSEGLATSFEVDGAPPSFDGLGRDNPARRRRLIEAANRGRLQPLDQFITLASTRTADAPGLRDLYAQSWGLFHFLFKHRRQDLEQYLAALAQLEPGWRNRGRMYREFVRAFGPIQPLRRDWHRFLHQLRTASLAQGQ
jgi:hypothetical protein